MFSFFKKKIFQSEPVKESPLTRVLSQYMTNVDSMIEMYTKSNKDNLDIIEQSVNIVKEDNKLLGELFNTLTEKNIEVSLVKNDKVKELLLPLNNHQYSVKIKHTDFTSNESLINYVKERISYPVIERLASAKSSDYFYPLSKLIIRRNTINSSNLTKNFKSFLLEKIKKEYDILIAKFFCEVYPNTYMNLKDEFYTISHTVIEDLFKYERLYSSKINCPYFKKIVVVPDSFRYSRVESKKYLDDLLLSHQIVIAETEKIWNNTGLF